MDNGENLLRMLLSETYTVDLGWSAVKTTTFNGRTLTVNIYPKESCCSSWLSAASSSLSVGPTSKIVVPISYTQTHTGKYEKFQSSPLNPTPDPKLQSSIWFPFDYSCCLWIAPPLERIREGSAAATEGAAHQLGGSEHFETEPLQHGLTGDVTLTGLDAQSSRQTHTAHTHTSITVNKMIITASYIQLHAWLM